MDCNSAVCSHKTCELGDHLNGGDIIVGGPIDFFWADVDDNWVAAGCWGDESTGFCKNVDGFAFILN